MTRADRTASDFGNKLREARERKGISLRQIANATKISIVALEALERSDISRLPGGIFSRAFVRSYASEVGLDPEATIQDFVAQFPHDSVTAGHPSEPVEDAEALESERRVAGTFLWILVVSIPIAAGVLYFGTLERESGPRAAAPAAAPAPAAESTPLPNIATSGTAAPTLPPATMPTPPPAATPAPQPAATPPLTAAPPSPPPSPSPSSPAPPPSPTGTPTEADQPPAAVDHLTVGLSVRRPVWVSATVDGRKTIERLLQAGEQQTIEVRRELVLTAGDASAITMKLNGADARVLGKTGEVVTARLNLGNFKEYLQVR